MTDYVKVLKLDRYVEVMLLADHEKLLNIGQKLEAICPDAYMNGYNWGAFFQYYLAKNAPDILDNMAADPEAGMYVAYWPLTADNEARAEKFLTIIRSLIEQEEELCRIVKEYGNAIEWD